MALFVLFAAASFIYVIGNLFDTSFDMPKISYGPLSKVGNLRLEDGKFCWNSVRNATCYVVEADGKKFTVSSNEWRPEGDVTFVRVKAVDATNKYKSSDWSVFDASALD